MDKIDDVPNRTFGHVLAEQFFSQQRRFLYGNVIQVEAFILLYIILLNSFTTPLCNTLPSVPLFLTIDMAGQIEKVPLVRLYMLYRMLP